jgi:NADH dehydrogenase
MSKSAINIVSEPSDNVQALEERRSSTFSDQHHIVIIGGGFGGLWAAKSLRKAPVRITLIDKRNFHLFQPLLYQVATGGLSPADIASPLRGVLGRQKNTTVLLGKVLDIDRENNQVILENKRVHFNSLIVAAGSENSYFGRGEWEDYAPGLKGIEDALTIRSRIYAAFEEAESTRAPEQRQLLTTFIIVGAGPTGVELAGAIAEIANITLKSDFRTIDTSEARIVLLEGGKRILPTFPESLARAAYRSLEKLNIEIRTDSMVVGFDDQGVEVEENDGKSHLTAQTIIWAAGVKPSRLGKILAGDEISLLDEEGRVKVDPGLSLPGYANIYVIGDLANYSHQTGKPLPGVAPVAMSQGRYVANCITRHLRGKPVKKYRYIDRGNMAVIGRAAAVADLGWLRVSGYPAWLLWLFIHLMHLVEYDNRLIVFIQWAWNYFSRKRGARLITYRLNSRDFS